MKLSTENIVKLLQVRGIGKAKILKLNEHLTFRPSDDKELAELVFEMLIPVKEKPPINEILESFKKGEQLIETSTNKGIYIISLNDANYPFLLKEIKTPPIVLNAIGSDFSVLNNPSIAVIGTRDASDYGKQIGERIGFKLGESKINVVSGLALGCDTAAHVGCLKAKGITIAILAHGLDYVYPKENTKLAEIIAESGGVLLSEYFVGTRGLPNYFVERDRLQAGMSKATIVVETDVKGGTMHTVNFTLESKRILAAYNHPLERQFEKSRGNQLLIREGKATPLQTKEDIDSLIYLVNPDILNKQDSDTKTQILDIQLPLFNATTFESLIGTIEKIKKVKKQKVKKTEHPKIFNMLSIIFDLDMTIIDTSIAAEARKRGNWKGVYQMVSNFKIYDGIREVLDYLDKSKILYSIVTSSPSNYCEKVCNHFKIISTHKVCYHDTNNRKPHSEPITLAVKKMKSTSDKVISFGDRDIDIVSSNAAGVISVACMWGAEDKDLLLKANPTYVINNPNEIIPLIQSIEKKLNNPS